MPETNRIVINTSPLITLVAALGDLQVLQSLYRQVMVPYEVSREIIAGGKDNFAVEQFEKAEWLIKIPSLLEISPILTNSIDLGEASVIQLALNEKIKTVCIDEVVGRRLARLNGLSITGSIGILLRAKKEWKYFSFQESLKRIKEHDIWISEKLAAYALKMAGE